MRIGIFGTGGVGRTLGSRFIELGHEVLLGFSYRGQRYGDRMGRAGGGASVARHVRRRGRPSVSSS